VEYFFYALSGSMTLSIDGRAHTLGEAGYAFVPSTVGFRVEARESTRLLMLRKVYEPAEGVSPGGSVVGNQGDVPASPYCGDAGARLQELLPNDLAYDIAMNIFTFDSGHSLPITETHVMEHGLYMLQGKGVYFLGDAWMEVEATDFIWMGPWCPQSYYAAGPVPSRYIYYKNVNREIPL